MSERQQLAEAIRQAWSEADLGPFDEVAAAAFEDLLVAAERAGYERCKRDATTGIKALPDSPMFGTKPPLHGIPGVIQVAEALAVVAALNATQESS